MGLPLMSFLMAVGISQAAASDDEEAQEMWIKDLSVARHQAVISPVDTVIEPPTSPG